MTQQSREQLQGFIQRADRVERSTYWKKMMQEGGAKVSFRWAKDAGGGYAHNFPDEEAVDALMLTARMFVQNNDPVSFGNMANLDADPGLSDAWKERLHDVRTGLNGFLDGNSMFQIDGQRYTHREIFYTFLYGYLAHTDKKYAAKFNLWKSNTLAFPMIEWEFHHIVGRLLAAVDYLAHWTRMELNGEAIPPIERAAAGDPTDEDTPA